MNKVVEAINTMFKTHILTATPLLVVNIALWNFGTYVDLMNRILANIVMSLSVDEMMQCDLLSSISKETPQETTCFGGI